MVLLDIILLLIAVVILIAIIRMLPSFKSIKSIGGLIVNAVVGVGLFLVTNLLGVTSIQVNIISVLVCAIGGIPGSLILIVLNLFGLY
jgi:hypothetical protein